MKIRFSLGRAEARIQKLWDKLGRGRAPGGVLGIGRDGRLWIDGHPLGPYDSLTGGFLVVTEGPVTAEEWESTLGPLARGRLGASEERKEGKR
jgi:hypothetical protein